MSWHSVRLSWVSAVKVGILDDPFKEGHLIQLNEAYILWILTETLAAHVEAIFPDQTVPVWADKARTRTLAKFHLMAPVELLMTHLALSDAKMKGKHGWLKQYLSLEPRSPRSRHQQVQRPVSSWFINTTIVSLCPHLAEGSREISGVSYKNMNPIHEGYPLMT